MPAAKTALSAADGDAESVPAPPAESVLKFVATPSQFPAGVAPPALWPELSGKTVGILGFGHIGEALTQRLRAFGMTVCAIRRRAQPAAPEGVAFIGGPERLDEVLGLSDYLAVTLSLSPETRGLLNADRLGRMKPSAYLINIARAEIVDERALYQALAGGRD